MCTTVLVKDKARIGSGMDEEVSFRSGSQCPFVVDAMRIKGTKGDGHATLHVIGTCALTQIAHKCESSAGVHEFERTAGVEGRRCCCCWGRRENDGSRCRHRR